MKYDSEEQYTLAAYIISALCMLALVWLFYVSTRG